MRSNDILTVRVDLENGEYVLSRYDGQQSIVKPINDGERKSYDKKYMEARRKEIAGPNVPEEREKQIDVGLYDALVEFDQEYGTEYAKKYIDITTETISIKVSESKRDFKIRSTTQKMAKFIEARMTIDYDLNIFKSAKSLSLRDRFQIFRQAFAQKLNGIQVNVNKPRKAMSEPLLGTSLEPSPEEQEIDEIIKSIRTEREEKFARTEPEEKNVVIEENQPTEQNPIIEQTAEETAEQPASPKVQYEQKPKKALSRAKSRQAFKKASREAKKIKNIYQTKQKDNTRPVKTQEQIQAEARARKQAKAQKNAEAMRIARQQVAEQKRLKEEQERAEQERIAKEEQAKKDARLSSRVKRILLGKKDSEIQEEHIVKRFTRKLKDQKDSIRNKVHIPKVTKRTLAGAAGAVCVVVAIGIGIAGFGDNGTSKTEVSQPAIESTYNTSTENTASSQSQSPEEKDYTEAIKQAIRFEENGQVQTGASTTEETITKTEESAPIVEENTEKPEESAPVVEESTEKDGEEATVTDSSKEYLSSVRVGATMNIESGKYFECPDGTGNFGYFENQQNGTKEISIIGITTSKGYFSTTDTSMSLYELKQMFPDAKFSYHFICRYEDGSTKTLGWLTENSMEQNIENTRQSSIDEGR